MIHAICNSRVVFEQLKSWGGKGLCMPIEVFEQLNSRGGICMGLCMPIEVLVITGVFVEVTTSTCSA